MTDPLSGGEWFEPAAVRETVAASALFEASNVCRVAALSTMFSSPPGWTTDVAPALTELGFARRLVERPRDWRDQDPFQDGDRPLATNGEPDQARIARWADLNETGRARSALSFVVAVLGSVLERESTAAAAVLLTLSAPRLRTLRRRRSPHWRRYDFGPWDDELFDIDLRSDLIDPPDTDDPAPSDLRRWNPDRWREVYDRVTSTLGSNYDDPYLLGILARWRLDQARHSPDRIVRQLAMAALTPSAAGDDDGPRSPSPPRSSATGALVVSTMIHGTWGWKGDWWRPQNSFHDYILRTYRPNLFSRGARFSWSGAYSRRQRVLAASDFVDWGYDVAPHGVQSLFAHSYGGEVAARAIVSGANVHELVLLSVPVTRPLEEIVGTTTRIVDVRLPFDPVLALARTKQRMPTHPAVTPVVFSRWTLDHGATHSPDAWEYENVAQRGRL